MISVGFDTYCNLLSECVADIKQKQNKNPYDASPVIKREPAIVDISVNAYIPDEWAQTYEQKILEYKRLSDVTTLSELENMQLNFKDRFSKIKTVSPQTTSEFCNAPFTDARKSAGILLSPSINTYAFA